jgi:hypothetical protein
MRPFAVGALLLLLQAGCVLYERRPYAAEPVPSSSSPARRIISQEEAVEQAFRLCQDRDLRVDRVERATLDSTGRWHVTLAGYLDRAQMLLDGSDGKLLRGRFRRGEGPPISTPQSPPTGVPPPPETQQPPVTPPPANEPDDLD